MRLDKYLKVSRLIKRRTVANQACDGERISVNGRQVKPGYQVKLGDVIEIAYDGDMARLYADGKLAQDDFWKGRPIRYALRRLPAGTKGLVLKILPWASDAKSHIFIDKSF